MDLEKQKTLQEQSLASRGQAHVLQWWDKLDESQRRALLEDVSSLDWSLLEPLIQTHVVRRPDVSAIGDLHPAEVYPKNPSPEQATDYERAKVVGTEALREGRVAAFTVAGGQGTRLGYDGPKGEVIVSPVGGRSLFCLFAQTVSAARRRYDVAIPWYIMTSPANDDATRAYFDREGYFGLPREDVMFFPQGMLPAFGLDGKLLLEEKHRVAMAPDGHGGSLKALYRSGALDDMKRRGIDVISYFQVDNPLVKPFDPLFIGLHIETGSEMSTKVTAKADDLEKVGNVCVSNGKTTVVEYSDFPELLARKRNPDGSRRFNAGNLAIHLLDRAFVERIAGSDFRLPIRRAEKKVPYIDEQGEHVEPTTPNAVKLESFVFDALPLARHPLVLEVDRAEEFSPVKNATGVDSLESSKRDQNLRACRWLEQAGLDVPRKPDGSPDVTIALAPTFALDAGDVAAQMNRIGQLKPGGSYDLT